MTEKKTTLIDIYEAAGAEVNEDRSMVSLRPEELKPFDITLKVYPYEVKLDPERGESVVFHVMLDDTFVVLGGQVFYGEWDEQIELPVKQVRISKEK